MSKYQTIVRINDEDIFKYVNIELVFKFNKQPTELFTQALKQNIISLLAHFILMRMYAEVEETGNKSLYLIFEKEWRRYSSKILLAVSFDLL